MRALRYQTYYNRGSNADWKARQEEVRKLETAVVAVVVTPCVALTSLVVGALGFGLLLVALEGPSDSQRLGNPSPSRLERRMR